MGEAAEGGRAEGAADATVSDDVYLVLDPDGHWRSAKIVEIADAPRDVPKPERFRARVMPREMAERALRVFAEYFTTLREVDSCPRVRYAPFYRLTHIEPMSIEKEEEL